MSLSLISKHDSSLTVSNRGRRKEIHIIHVSNFSGHAWRTTNSLCKGLMGLFPTLRNECKLFFSWHKKTQPRPRDLMSLVITMYWCSNPFKNTQILSSWFTRGTQLATGLARIVRSCFIRPPAALAGFEVASQRFPPTATDGAMEPRMVGLEENWNLQHEIRERSMWVKDAWRKCKRI